MDVVGWVRFGAELDRTGPDQKIDPSAALRAMLAALPGKISEHDQLRMDPHLVIGLRPGPFTGHPRHWLTAARSDHPGRTDRSLSVAALVGRCSSRAAGASDSNGGAALLLRGHAEWGEALPEHLDGDYAFALWDAGQGELSLTRDPLGTRPLYYHRLPDGVVFASRLDAVLAHPALRASLTTDGVRGVLAGISVPGLTVYDGVYAVRPGHAMHFTLGGDHERRHWRLGTAVHTDDTATTIRRTRELLENAVASRSAGAKVGSLLSGGLDSSTIAALCAHRGAGPVRTFSVDYLGHEARFRPHIARPTPDSPYVRDMVAHLSAQHTDVLLDTADLTDPVLWRQLVVALDEPTILADVEPSMYLLYQRLSDDVHVVFGGEGADELFGGFPWFHHPEWALAPDFPWARTTDELVATLFAPSVTALEVRAFRDEQYRGAIEEHHPAGPDATLDERMRQVIHLFLTRFLPEQLERAHRFGAAIGIDVRAPFCDRELVEYVFGVPWSVQTFDAREKSLLRAAAADLLAPSVVARRKSGYPMTGDDGYDRVLQRGLGKLHLDADAPVRAFVDEDVLRALHSDVDAAPRLSRHEMELALRLNGWMAHRGLSWLR
jgi:asparagine synthase (glutamine-hydrolysing)